MEKRRIYQAKVVESCTTDEPSLKRRRVSERLDAKEDEIIAYALMGLSKPAVEPRSSAAQLNERDDIIKNQSKECAMVVSDDESDDDDSCITDTSATPKKEFHMVSYVAGKNALARVVPNPPP
eukprot:CAMPEP_0194220304 /NCGR_PEP_ID=MMETSP0156-20130528/28026_1 /TAXON_ID=33649 /ORGANISM="Thalassionema nitzschioides, Strain L26-B" /LENGTH=122 /DNA_ID=CAMNT_0038950283 /DNA_START=147 /DNA_END=516 /DNA_ORIENTATION=+